MAERESATAAVSGSRASKAKAHNRLIFTIPLRWRSSAMGSGAIPTGQAPSSSSYPALTRWANECRRFAAGVGVLSGTLPIAEALFCRPSGTHYLPGSATHGLRRGLYSCSASRLGELRYAACVWHSQYLNRSPCAANAILPLPGRCRAYLFFARPLAGSAARAGNLPHLFRPWLRP